MNLHVPLVIDIDIHISVREKHPRPIMLLKAIGPTSEQFTLGPKEGKRMIAVLTNTQETDVTYTHPTDKKGNPAPIQSGSLVWKSSNEAIAKVTPISEDPIMGTIKATGLNGACQIWPEADADLGDNVVTVQGERVDVQATGGLATAIGGPTLSPVREQA